MDALCGLGIAYYFGQGVPVDREQGKKLVREASERGHARAKSLLKLM
jgi:TPR repeat protein